MILDHRKLDVEAHFKHPGLQRSTAIHQLSMESEVSKDLGPHIGGTRAFKWGLRATADGSRGILLPIQGLLLFPDEG